MIHFVGAGSGAPDLITVRGVKLLQEADCVIYAGSLVNPELLNYCKPGTEIYDSSVMTLESVLDVIRTGYKKGREIVRLHTGDPSLYGAIGEQIDALEKENMEYDITPGVTAAFSAAASLGRELTLPGVTQTVIFTRVEGRTPMPERESIRNLAAIGATMAVYLSATRSERLKNELLEGGYDPRTPVAVCYRVSWPEEKIFITDVENLPKTVENNNLSLTTLFLIGDAVKTDSFLKSRLYAADFSTLYRKAENED